MHGWRRVVPFEISLPTYTLQSTEGKKKKFMCRFKANRIVFRNTIRGLTNFTGQTEYSQLYAIFAGYAEEHTIATGE